jgi:hypothetical protein
VAAWYDDAGRAAIVAAGWAVTRAVVATSENAGEQHHDDQHGHENADEQRQFDPAWHPGALARAGISGRVHGGEFTKWRVRASLANSLTGR